MATKKEFEELLGVQELVDHYKVLVRGTYFN